MSLRLAVWSGPRNLSTAMMRSWENRDDCEVLDEPFYGYYLSKTGLAHPDAEQVMASQSLKWEDVVAKCRSDAPLGSAIYYQKQMTFHLLPEIDRDWLSEVTHCFLIRDPRLVVASYAAIRETPTLDDLGFAQQAELYESVCQATGSEPLVIDSSDFLSNPRRYLQAWCDILQIPFTEKMLSWPSGPRATDGVWAPHWYRSVWASTGFASAPVEPRPLPAHLKALADAAKPYYEALYRRRLVPKECL